MNENQQLKAFVAFLFVFMVMALSQAAMAATAPFTWVTNASGAYKKADTAEALCQLLHPTYHAFTGVAGTAGSGSGAIGGVNHFFKWAAVPAGTYCRTVAGGVNLAYVYNSQYCTAPATSIGGTAPNATCTVCPTGYVEAGGVCTLPTPCTDNAGQVHSSGYYDLGTNENATPDTTTCDGTCELSYNGGGVVARQVVNGVYHYFSQGSYVVTSSTCSVADAKTASSNLPAASCNPATQDQGTVNGNFVCLDRESNKTTTDAPPVTNPDGSTDQTSTTTDSATGETTTTVTHTAPDGTVTKTTSTKPTVPTDFCKNNPNDPTCKKDDIPWGTIPEAGIIPTHDVPVDTAYTVIGGEGVCPADQTISFMGTGLTWSYQPICTFAEMIRPLVIGLAWLSFAFIIVGGLSRAK